MSYICGEHPSQVSSAIVFYFDIPLMISVAQSETAALASLSSSWVLSVFALFHLSFPYFSHSDFPPPLPPVHQILSWPNKH